jgi:hypothetical protein
LEDVDDKGLMRTAENEIMKTLTEPDEVSSMYPLLADVAPEDWEDASNYERQPGSGAMS